MIKKSLLYLFPLAVAAVAGAHDSGESHTNSGAGLCFHRDIQQGIVLTATTNAPAGASGKAQIIAVDNNGTNLSLLFVKTIGLTNGTYNVSLTDLGGSNTYSLGSLNVAPRRDWFGFRLHNGNDDDDSDGEHASTSWNNWVGRCAGTNSAWTNVFCGGGSTNQFWTNAFHWYTNCLTVGSGSFVLPSGLAPTNVGGIFVSDTNGVVDLSGSFAGVTNSTSIRIETVSLIPGTATNVQGQATLTMINKNGKTFEAFKLTATGLEAKQKLYLTANGTNTFRVCTSPFGTLRVNSLGRIRLVNLQTVVATDVSSNVVFSVSF